MYPYYPGYRPPPVTSQSPPIPRSSYLHHCQYTQLHVNPGYYISLPHPVNQPLPPTMNQGSPPVELAFEPPPRDRRIFEKTNCEESRLFSDDNRNAVASLASVNGNAVSGGTSIEQLQETFKNLTASQVASLPTDNFIKYLDNGCMIGETIAKRNEQRPCFKNIQNLCNRTRSEVMKPNITVSNIHSQGLPWATKDFIFAFVRAINCWCILRGYLESKDGNLGKIEKVISDDFRVCYANWEKCTKQLTHYLIQTFHNLDEANFSSNHSGLFSSSDCASSIARSKCTPPHKEQLKKSTADTQNYTKLQNKEITPIKKIPGILHIPSSSSTELGEPCNPTSEDVEKSTRDDDSDNEGRIYMKPGSYNVPTKNKSNSPPDINPNVLEFFNRTKNITSRIRKAENSNFYVDDQVWKTPDFVKHQEESSFNTSVAKIYDMSLVQPNKQIENWLNNEMNVFNYMSHDTDNNLSPQTENHWQSNSDTSKLNKGSECEIARHFRNIPIGKEYSVFRKNNWEYKNGGLTITSREIFENIFKDIERTEFFKNINLAMRILLTDNMELTSPPDLSVMVRKLKNNLYSYVNEVVHDFRHYICYSCEIFTHDRYVLGHISIVQEIFENTLKQSFVGIDFSHITGKPADTIGPLVLKDCTQSKRNAEEAAVRLRDVKHMPGHLDLCRPFAAHCIGYPVVTLGFGFKSYIGYRMRQRKQRDVAKENEFYQQLLLQALPLDVNSQTENQSTAIVPATQIQNNIKIQPRQSQEKNGHIPNGTISNGIHQSHAQKSHRKSLEKSKEHVEHENRHADKHTLESRQKSQHIHTNGAAIGAGSEEFIGLEPDVRPTKRREKKEQDKDKEALEYLQRLETDNRKLKSDLQNSRQSEQELRLQVAHLTTSDKVSKGELSALQREIEELQSRLQSTSSSRQSDRQTISTLERRIAEERRLRSNCEAQLSQERKNRKQEEARAAQVAAQSSRGECTELCKSRRRELESEITECRSTQRWTDERITCLERENTSLVEQLRDTDILMSALSAMQEKNTHLENSLSAETRIKLDLFSALGEAKRQLEIRENANQVQQKEIEELKGKIAQVLAVMPNDTFATAPTPSSTISRVRLADSTPGSTLDPNATVYTPKSSLVTSTEA
ncbi:hypothetical protein FQA39_LY01387 [Lamprigera yunnana]|nr:hypothetical protein FQA39_LY01387 [Lamprigera yunnana]